MKLVDTEWTSEIEGQRLETPNVPYLCRYCGDEISPPQLEDYCEKKAEVMKIMSTVVQGPYKR
jgi:hypothetical protein